MKLGKQELSVSCLIRRNWLDTEMRAAINQTKVRQYAMEIKDGANFPLPVAFIDPKDEIVRVGDGFHRILAYEENGVDKISVDLKRGSRRDAFLYGIESNRKQKGMPFSTGDLEKCILTLLKDEETRKWQQNKIAETVGCSQGYVSTVAKKFKDVVDRPDTIVDRNGVVRSMPQSKDKAVVIERKEKALDMFARGTPKIEIGRKLGVARASVQRYIKDAMEEAELVKCPHCNGTGLIKQGET